MIGEDYNLQITKESSIPTTKYLSLKENYDERTKVLEKIIKDENKTKEDFEKEKTERIKSDQKIIELSQDVTKQQQVNFDIIQENSELKKGNQVLTVENANLKNLHKQLEDRANAAISFVSEFKDVKKIDGKWEFMRFNALTNESHKEILQIKDGEIYRVNGNRHEQAFTIKNFIYDSINGNVFFIKHTYPEVSQPTLEPYSKEFEMAVGRNALQIRVFINELTIKSKGILIGFENQVFQVTYKKMT